MINFQYHLCVVSIVAIVCFASGCRPMCNGCQNTAAPDAEPIKQWHITKSGRFLPDDVFFDQFGAAPFEIAVSGEISPAQPDTEIRFQVFDVSGKSVVFTGLMEKQLRTPDANGNTWRFSAKGSEGEILAIENTCIDCHQQRAAEDFLFSIPGGH